MGGGVHGPGDSGGAGLGSPCTSTEYCSTASPAGLLATQLYRPPDASPRLSRLSMPPPTSSHVPLLSATGSPSWCQERVGGGWPLATHSSAKGLPATAFTTRGPPPAPSMVGGTREEAGGAQGPAAWLSPSQTATHVKCLLLPSTSWNPCSDITSSGAPPPPPWLEALSPSSAPWCHSHPPALPASSLHTLRPP